MTLDTRSSGSSAGSSGTRRRSLYGRRHGRALRSGQQRVIDTLLPRLRIDLPDDDRSLDPLTLFPQRPTDVWIEVGFGAGEHMAAQAAANPQVGIIGCEPYVNGIAALLLRAEEQELANIRLYDDDARDLMARLADNSIGRLFLLFPDPWPKARHHKRRFISPRTLDQLARVMKDDAELRFATDDPGYLAWTLEHFDRHRSFSRSSGGSLGGAPDWPGTRYEAKAGRAGRNCSRLRFRRLPRTGPAVAGLGPQGT